MQGFAGQFATLTVFFSGNSYPVLLIIRIELALCRRDKTYLRRLLIAIVRNAEKKRAL
jgi:hypothetical protein